MANEPTKDELQAQLDTVRKDLRLLAGMTGARVESEYDGIRTNARARWDALSEETRRMLAETAEDARARGETAYADTEAMLKRNPFASVGIAFGLGYLLGQILRR